MPNTHEQIVDNYREIDQRVTDAARRAGRMRSEVTVVAVTKYVECEWIRPLVDAGCRDLGESRPQVLWKKSAELDADVDWHMIGHLQRNKVDRTLPLVRWVHSVDSERLLAALDQAAHRMEQAPPQVLLEVNISGDASKHGWTPAEMEQLVGELAKYERLRICGLMGMSALGSGPDEARRQFADLKALFEKIRRRVPNPHDWEHLSMGMSGDFEIAVEEGATLVRVGSALFDGCEL